jgi:hypothetical protein
VAPLAFHPLATTPPSRTGTGRRSHVDPASRLHDSIRSTPDEPLACRHRAAATTAGRGCLRDRGDPRGLRRAVQQARTPGGATQRLSPAPSATAASRTREAAFLPSTTPPSTTDFLGVWRNRQRSGLQIRRLQVRVLSPLLRPPHKGAGMDMSRPARASKLRTPQRKWHEKQGPPARHVWSVCPSGQGLRRQSGCSPVRFRLRIPTPMPFPLCWRCRARGSPGLMIRDCSVRSRGQRRTSAGRRMTGLVVGGCTSPMRWPGLLHTTM